MTTDKQIQLPELSWNSHELFLNEGSFIPHICRADVYEKGYGYNTAIIELPADIKSSLDWSHQIEKARELIENDLYIIWKFNFGLEAGDISLTDPVAFESFKRAIKYFVQEYEKEFEKRSLGAIFYEGNSQFHAKFPKAPQIDMSWDQWKADRFITEGDSCDFYSHFFADFFLSYLQMLSCEVPDRWTVFLPIKMPKASSSAELFDLLSKERYEHFLLCLEGGEFPFPAIRWKRGFSVLGGLDLRSDRLRASRVANIGLFFPANTTCYRHYGELNAVIDAFARQGITYRILYEKFAIEDWNELDYIVVATKHTDSVKRMAYGFCAASGTVVLTEGTLGASMEISLENFLKEIRGRGI